MSNPIDCTLHDHLEITCLFHYDIRLTMKDGTSVEGRAVTTHTLGDKTELLELASVDGTQQVVMNEISYLEVLTPGARFAAVDFEAAG